MPLPSQPAGVPWPKESWPEGQPVGLEDGRSVERLVADFFTPDAQQTRGTTHALLVVQSGRIVAERYGSEADADTTLPSWSMAKSMLHAVVGILAQRGALSIHDPAPVPAWQNGRDDRAAITIDHLLRMSSGLAFNEDYVDADGSDTIRMLFGEAKDDAAAFAEAKPLVAPPGSIWSYSSGTTNILAAIVRRVLGVDEAGYRAFLSEALFDRIGMKSAAPRFDSAGTWIASSFVYATARDFARFGLLYLRDGVWQDDRILPEGWVDYARTPTPGCDDQYGAHFWLAQNGSGIFSANGFRSQYTLMSPSRDLVVVRLGDSLDPQKRALLLGLDELVRAFPEQPA